MEVTGALDDFTFQGEGKVCGGGGGGHPGLDEKGWVRAAVTDHYAVGHDI